MVKLKVGFLVSHPIQYFSPIYKELAKQPTVDLAVLFRARVGVDAYRDVGFGQTVQWDIPLLEGYPYVFLSEKSTVTGVELKVISEIFRRRFEVLLVHGYNSPTNLLAILVAKMCGAKVLMRGDTRLGAHHQQAPLKRAFKQALFRLMDGFVCIGSLNRAYYAAHGVPEERLFFAPFSVDNAFFALPAVDRATERARLRTAWDVPADAVAVLSASKFIPRKRVDDLLWAFAAVQARVPNAWLIIAGSGPDADGLKQLAQDLRISRIRFIGFQNQGTLPAVLAANDLFVLPSSDEPWGLAVNEAMAAGLPVIVSDDVGAAPDLVAGQETGMVFPCGDLEALAKALEELITSDARREALGRNALRVIAEWDNAVCARQLLVAARTVSSAESNSAKSGQ